MGEKTMEDRYDEFLKQNARIAAASESMAQSLKVIASNTSNLPTPRMSLAMATMVGGLAGNMFETVRANMNRQLQEGVAPEQVEANAHAAIARVVFGMADKMMVELAKGSTRQ